MKKMHFRRTVSILMLLACICTLIMPTSVQAAASVIIVNEKGQVLLGRRSDNNKWGYAGGSIEVDEKVEDCAKRELDMISEPIRPVMANYINKVTGREKRVIFLGSSVTYGSATGGISFADFISERNGLTMTKEAVSGTTLVDKDEESYVSRLKTIKADTCDLFVCQLSTNDASLKLPIQKVEEAIDFIIDYVREKWDCPIAFYTNPRYESHQLCVIELMAFSKRYEVHLSVTSMPVHSMLQLQQGHLPS